MYFKYVPDFFLFCCTGYNKSKMLRDFYPALSICLFWIKYSSYSNKTVSQPCWLMDGCQMTHMCLSSCICVFYKICVLLSGLPPDKLLRTVASSESRPRASVFPEPSWNECGPSQIIFLQLIYQNLSKWHSKLNKSEYIVLIIPLCHFKEKN